MSALAVRTVFRAWADAVTYAPFYDTINRHTDPTDDVWFTLEFFANAHENLTYCHEHYTERGEVDVIWCAKGGSGDEALLAVLEPGMDAFLANKDPNVTIERWEPVDEYSEGDADSWYRLGIRVTYTYRRGS